MTQEEYINKCNIIHNYEYDYSLVEYKNLNSKIKVICPKHGIYEVQAGSHLSGTKCKQCWKERLSKKQNSNTEEFIQKSKKKFGDRLDYSKVDYKNNSTKVIIICPEHGEFEVTPGNHLRSKTGCPKCSYSNLSKQYQKSKEQFIKDARKIHGDKYDYSEVNYTGSFNEVIIICPIHGEFKQTPSCHLQSTGCPKCGIEQRAKDSTKTTEQFIIEAKKIHGNRYNYSKVNYINSKTDIEIICSEHGSFWKNPNAHLHGSGCPKCCKSYGELEIEQYLIDNNIKYITQYEIPIDTSINKTGIAQLDFYLPDYNMIIEYNGEQHYKPIKRFGGQLAFDNYQVPRDNYVKQYCNDNNIKLVEIKYNDNIIMELEKLKLV